MSKGIVLLSLQKPKTRPAYAWMTFNLVSSIRYYSKIPIHILHDGNLEKLPAWQYEELKRAATLEKVDPDDVYHNGRFEPGKMKLSMYKYLPFTENIYFDVDAVCIKNPEITIDKPYASLVRGWGKNDRDNYGLDMFWAKPAVIWEHYKFTDEDKLPFLNSSFQWIKKGKETKKLYSQALKNFLNPIPVNKLLNAWGKGGQPDELYMNVALAQLKMDPTSDVHPCYFRTKHEYGAAIPLETIKQGHSVIALFGDVGTNHKSVLDYYDRLLGKIFKEMYAQTHQYKSHVIMQNKFIQIK